MKILVTGASGFIAKNLIVFLKATTSHDIVEYSHVMSEERLKNACSDCNFVFHLAGVNRPQDDSEFKCGNEDFTKKILFYLEEQNNCCPVLYSSSVQAELKNPYGISKKNAESALLSYAERNKTKVFIYRLPNVFGKWSKPNYNSVVSTFCYNVSRNLPIKVNDSSYEMTLAYIDDVVIEFISALNGKVKDGYCKPSVLYHCTVGELAGWIRSFAEMRKTRFLPNQENPLVSKLYSTYLSYLAQEDFSYPLLMHEDFRGSFTEMIRTIGFGQFSVNISKTGIIKGNHYHNSKHEKFLVVSGEGSIRFRRIDDEKVIEYKVSGKKLEVVEIPPGYTHLIENIGEGDLVTFMWANENFDPQNHDTYALEV